MTAERGMHIHENIVFDGIVQKAKEQIDFAERLHEFRDPYDSLNILSERILEGDYPVIYSNHTQHVNIAAFRGIYNRLPIRPDDLYVATAYSLDQGDQGKSLADFTNSLKPVLESEDVHFIPLARSKDLKKYRSEKDVESARRLISETRQSQQRIMDTLQSDAGFMFFPEATTEGGMKGEDGSRKGLQEVDNKMFSDLIGGAVRAGRNIAFLPAGIVDANRIIEPRKTDPTVRTKFQFVKSKIGLRPSTLAYVNIGKVFQIEDVVSNDIDISDFNSVNDFMMRKVAELLPEDVRGFYR